ncbi:MAG: CDP-glycerol glycerophosphotransferase family protein [Pseudomonadales bacterium]
MRALFYVEHDYAFAILRPLQREILARGGEVRWLLAGGEADANLLAAEEQRLHSVDAAVTYQPQAVFVPGDRVPGFIPGLKVEVFHGINEDKRGGTYPERGLFDLYCTEGPGRTAMLQPLAEQRGYFRVVETGWIKLDALFEAASEPVSRIDPRPHIMFASTFTPRLSSAEVLFDEIKRLVQTGRWRWSLTLHPKMAAGTVARYQELDALDAEYCGPERIIELLCSADVLVCDNSSILQEFLLLKKPVVTHRNRNPQPSMLNIDDAVELESAIETALDAGPALRAAIEAYGASITPFLDGKSSARVFEAAQSMLDAGWQDRKPRNLWRNLKMRRQLGG